jgi:hypothetical protein
MSPIRSTRAVRAVLTGGLIAGALDISYAIVMLYARRGRSPMWTLQSVACGLLGRDSFDGGALSALLGLLCQFTIACGAAAVFYLASRVWPALVRFAVPAGIVYGICVYFAMTYVVVPLSRAPFKLRFQGLASMPELLVHMFFIGLPIALSVRRYAGTPE